MTGSPLKPWLRIAAFLNHHGRQMVYSHTGLVSKDRCHLLTSFSFRLRIFDRFHRRGTSHFAEN